MMFRINLWSCSIVLVWLVLIQSSFALLTGRDEKELVVISNPHSEDTSCSTYSSSSSNSSDRKNLDALLEPYYLLPKPLATQKDTFQEITYAKVMTVPVPIYRMKQPGRLSHLELEFDLVLVTELSKQGQARVTVVDVDEERANDSWFPGYYWSPIVMFSSESQDLEHVGWKFTALPSPESSSQHGKLQQRDTRLPHFYALMVQPTSSKEQEGVGIPLYGIKAAGWLADRIIS